jgi:hypothetical protein
MRVIVRQESGIKNHEWYEFTIFEIEKAKHRTENGEEVEGQTLTSECVRERQ